MGLSVFFPDKIKMIRDGDRVLEIGPGTSPHPRSNVLLEKRFLDEGEHVRQCGGKPAANADNRTVYYDGGQFPFSDGEFDYIICSHVIEHVDDVEMFCSEMFRVARAGYLEFPLIYYEYVFDIPEHVNVLIKSENDLVYLKKTAIFSEDLKPVQRLWYAALVSGYTNTASDLVPFTMQGFEWSDPFRVRKAYNIGELLHGSIDIPPKRVPQKSLFRVFIEKVKGLLG
jgi:SAM-dependent methyltransferase